MVALTIPPGLCQMGFTIPIWKSYLPKEPLPLVILAIVPGSPASRKLFRVRKPVVGSRDFSVHLPV